MDVLLSFVGIEDPFGVGPVAAAGPVVTLARNRPFEVVVLLAPAGEGDRAAATAAAVAASPWQPEVAVLPVPGAPTTTGTATALAGLEAELNARYPTASWWVGTASGSAAARAAMLLLAGRLSDARVVDLEPAADGGYAVREMPAGATLPEWLGVAEAEAPPTPTRVRGELGLVAADPAMMDILGQAEMLAASDFPVLLTGESGTGKELVAHYVHRLSRRRRRPLVPVNCAALPAELAESLLFGHRRGAFTGASRDHRGFFAQADGGTLFLDEVADLQPAAQAKLLRVLQDGRIQPLGDTRTQQVDVRIVAATNADLAGAVGRGAFREDLYFRLRVGILVLPPLRARPGDVARVAARLLADVNRQLREPRQLSPAALRRLQEYHWPGNVRELKACLERSCVLSRQPLLGPGDLRIDPPAAATAPAPVVPHEGFSLPDHLATVRRELIEQALTLAGANASQAARLLGVTPQAVHQYLKDRGSAA